jgi:hypothetical protein
MTLQWWPQLARVPRCAQCHRRIRRSAWAEKVGVGRTVGLCSWCVGLPVLLPLATGAG